MADKPKIIEFDKCPICGSKERLAKKLAEEEKKKGKVRKDLNFYAYILTGVIRDPLWEEKLLIGTAVPAYHIYLDVCLNPVCGTLYVVKIEIGEVRKPPPQKKPPPDVQFLKG